MIENIEERFKDLNILIIGDIILDHYLVGNVERISPEAPVPVVLHQKEMFRVGGAANVALNIKAMGANPYLFSIMGKDMYGAKFRELLEDAQISTDYLIEDASHQTTCKTRVLARNQQLLRYDRELIKVPTLAIQNQITQAIQKLVKTQKIAAIIFQDYNKGLLSPTIITAIIQIAQQNNIPTLVDPKKDNFWAYKNVTVFKPNLKEIKEALDLTLESNSLSLAILKEATKAIQHRINNNCTIITLGAKGIFGTNEVYTDWVKTKVRQVADVCGAGDTVVAIIALGIAAGLPLASILALSNIAGGQVCEKVGVVPIIKKKLLEEYSEK